MSPLQSGTFARSR